MKIITNIKPINQKLKTLIMIITIMILQKINNCKIKMTQNQYKSTIDQ